MSETNIPSDVLNSVLCPSGDIKNVLPLSFENAIRAMQKWANIVSKEKDAEISRAIDTIHEYQKGVQLASEKLTQQASTIEALKDEIMELRDSKLKDVKEINEQEAEIERLKELIETAWYDFSALPVHDDFTQEEKRLEKVWQQFKTENKL